MRVEPDTDVRALRRISLLVLRAKEDWGECCRPELNDIVTVIDRMKHDVAIGSPWVGKDLRQMASLVGGLACNVEAHSRLHSIVANELRDLVAEITPS